MMTAACFDLTPITVMPDELMALKAYSVHSRFRKTKRNCVRDIYRLGRDGLLGRRW
jgi:hypothetical protein